MTPATGPTAKLTFLSSTSLASSNLGVGLDNEDGHKRITTGEQFAIVGGSAETHERATETFIKTFEELKTLPREELLARLLSLRDVSRLRGV